MNEIELIQSKIFEVRGRRVRYNKRNNKYEKKYIQPVYISIRF